MSKRDIGNLLYDIDRLVEEQHWPDTYWKQVDQQTNKGRGYRFVYNVAGETTVVYARAMFELFSLDNFTSNPDDEDYDDEDWIIHADMSYQSGTECWADVEGNGSVPCDTIISHDIGLCRAHRLVILGTEE